MLQFTAIKSHFVNFYCQSWQLWQDFVTVKPTIPQIIFNGSNGVEVEAFIFREDIVIMRGKDKNAKAACSLAYLGGEIRSAYLSKFISSWLFTEEGKDYSFLCNWLVSRYAKTSDPDEPIWEATNGFFDNEDFVNLLNTLDELYSRAGFNDKEKYGMLRKAVMEHSGLSEYLFLKRPGDYLALKNAILEYVLSSGGFKSNCSFDD